MARVSVIIPTYNRASLLPQAVESVLGQSFKDLELIIVDDGSTDNTREVVAGFSGPITYLYQKNQGRSAARNNGYKISKGEYICFLDSDDLFSDEKIKKQVELLDAFKDVGLAYCDYRIINHRGEVIPKTDNFSRQVLQKGAIFRSLLYFCYVPLVSVIIRRECIIKEGGFNKDCEPAEDYDWLLRMTKIYQAGFVEEPLCSYRRHEGNTSSDRLSKATIEVLKHHLSLAGTKDILGTGYRSVYADRWKSVADYYYNSNDMAQALSYYFKALRSRPGLEFGKSIFPLILKSMLKKYLGPDGGTLRGDRKCWF